jgi:hypothetical protein
MPLGSVASVLYRSHTSYPRGNIGLNAEVRVVSTTGTPSNGNTPTLQVPGSLDAPSGSLLYRPKVTGECRQKTGVKIRPRFPPAVATKGVSRKVEGESYSLLEMKVLPDPRLLKSTLPLSTGSASSGLASRNAKAQDTEKHSRGNKICVGGRPPIGARWAEGKGGGCVLAGGHAGD